MQSQVVVEFLTDMLLLIQCQVVCSVQIVLQMSFWLVISMIQLITIDGSVQSAATIFDEVAYEKV